MSGQRIDPLLVETEGHSASLLGNEAIVRAALEAGVGFASGYPGTPSSEVTDSFARVADAAGIKFEYSVNEKIALEMAFAASLAGARSICAMKHLGLMYAGDPLSTIPYVGAVGGLVIVSAGDPSCRTSPNEHDQRYLGPMLHIPVLDPSSPIEAYEMARFAFELSEQSALPVLMRLTTRVCHTRGVIKFGSRRAPEVKGFTRDPKRFVPIPVNARRLRVELKDRIARATSLLEETDFFRATATRPRAVIASGAPGATCADLLRERGLEQELMLIRVGAPYPLLEERLVEALRGVDTALVVEELSPFLEDAVRALCAQRSLATTILGKRSGHLPFEFEYEPQVIQAGLRSAFELGAAPAAIDHGPVPPRPPTLCPGCPHRATQFALHTVFGPESLYFNDIGCYTLGYGPPIETADALLCMGAGFTLAAGVSRVTGQRTVGLLGDSTFFHSGMPALLNAIKEDVNMVAVILDNEVTAMTGFQDSPMVERSAEGLSRRVSIEGVVRALGARHVEAVDPYDQPAAIAAFERARDAEGVAVVIAQRACPVFDARATARPYKTGTYAIDPERCQTCGREADGHRCGACTTRGYEIHMASSRAADPSEEAEPKPAEAPCSTRCPVGLCVQGYIGHIAAGDYRQAHAMILEQLCLPDSVCRVCHRPCEEVCVRRDVDAPIAINDLKRFVADWAAREGSSYEPTRDPAHDRRVAVIGAGPSGLAAAHDLALRGYSVRLYDAEQRPGGLLRTGIPAYRLPDEAVQRDVDRILGLGVEFVGGKALGRDLSLAQLIEAGHDAIYVALGAHQGWRLELEHGPDRDGPEVTDALAYLKQSRQGQAPQTGRRVVVVGGGNSALDAARTALRSGADQVTIAYRRSRDEMPGLRDEIDAAEHEGVVLRTLLQPTRIATAGLVCLRTELGEPDASGRRRPVPLPGSETLVEADQIIAAIGQAPDGSGLGAAGFELTRRSDGTLQIDAETGQTSDPRIFAGGDVASGERTVTAAIAMGKRAAWGIDRALRGAEAADRRPPPPRVDPDATPRYRPRQRLEPRPRQTPAELTAEERTGSFDEVVSGLSEVQARTEASRCLFCGMCGNCRACLDLFGCPAFYVDGEHIAIDPDLCNGCGICTYVCANGAIYRVDDEDQEIGATP